MSFFEPNTWYPIADFPEDWKAKQIKLDLWGDGKRWTDCHWGPSDAYPGRHAWMSGRKGYGDPGDVPAKITHFMRVEGPQP